MHTLSITNARKEFLTLEASVQDDPILVTKHGRPVMTLLSYEQFEGMMETIEILRDQIFASRLKKSIAQAKHGKTVSLDQARAKLGL